MASPAGYEKDLYLQSQLLCVINIPPGCVMHLGIW